MAACKDGQVRVIDPDTAEVRDDLPALEGVAYSLAVAPDGSVLVGGQNGQLRRVGLEHAGDRRWPANGSIETRAADRGRQQYTKNPPAG